MYKSLNYRAYTDNFSIISTPLIPVCRYDQNGVKLPLSAGEDTPYFNNKHRAKFNTSNDWVRYVLNDDWVTDMDDLILSCGGVLGIIRGW